MRRASRNLVGVLFGLLIVAVLILGAAAIAYGATPQERGDQTRLWMESVLHVPIAPRTIEVGVDNPGNAGEASSDGVVRLAEWATWDTSYALYVRIHEYAHRPGNASCWGAPGSPDRATEEGIADALTRDLIPAAVRRFAPGWSWFVEVGGYAPEVASVRYAVRKMTGGTGWGRDERLMLRKLWAADCPTRESMLNNAGRN